MIYTGTFSFLVHRVVGTKQTFDIHPVSTLLDISTHAFVNCALGLIICTLSFANAIRTPGFQNRGCGFATHVQ